MNPILRDKMEQKAPGASEEHLARDPGAKQQGQGLRELPKILEILPIIQCQRLLLIPLCFPEGVGIKTFD